MPMVKGPSNNDQTEPNSGDGGIGQQHTGNSGPVIADNCLNSFSNSSDPMNAGLRALVRLVLRLIASGALTVAVDQFAGGLSPLVASLVLSGWASALTYAQVHVENKTGKKIGVAPAVNSAAVTDVKGGVT